MSIGRLTEHEQRVLEEMERELRRDRRLDRRLRALRRHGRPNRLRDAFRDPRPWAVVLLLAVCVALMAAGVVTSDPRVIWAFAVVWPLMPYAVLRLLGRWPDR
ncbi:DUF3040 domain-containing protein [Streptomyces sp. Tu 3180]|uniref:DUF3040 domain-containing protein n=1 Tax=Streptomyces sp. Tu 3180 TaxID=2682611 RepID=UPI0013597D83|nr:DUF3040 domain-containing protein [Streptomyces sp. Tu 3180]KAF3463851.1 DUF3040 domain-containing protein [Streptomyces sp. Tu 3180]